jgi:hypothetical protein
VSRNPLLQSTYNGGYLSKDGKRNTAEQQQRFLVVKWSLELDNPVFPLDCERDDVANAVSPKTSVPTNDVTGCSPTNHIQCKVLPF